MLCAINRLLAIGNASKKKKAGKNSDLFIIYLQMTKKEEKKANKIKWIWENNLVLKIRYNDEEDKTIVEYYEVSIKWFVTELIPQFKWWEIPWDCVEWFNFEWKLNK